MEKTLDHQTPEFSQEPEDNKMEIEQDFSSQYEKYYLDQENITHENGQDTASKYKDTTEKSQKDEEKKIEEKKEQYIIRTSDNGEKKKIVVVDLDEYNTDANAKNLLGKKKHEIKLEKKLEESKKEKVEKKLEESKKEKVEKEWSNMTVTECSNINKRKKKNNAKVNNIKNNTNTNIDMEKKIFLHANNNDNDKSININYFFEDSNILLNEEEEEEKIAQFYGNDDSDKFYSEQYDVSQSETNSNINNAHFVENPNANPSSTDVSLNNHMNNLHINNN